MDSAPLNLAHFHERRSDKFLRQNRFHEAAKALETSMLYLQNAYSVCILPKSREVLNTQKWEYERKLRQIQIRKQQHERLKQIVSLTETNPTILQRQPEISTAQSVAKSIGQTIQDFDKKFTSTLEPGSKENQDPAHTAPADNYTEQRKVDHEPRAETGKLKQLPDPSMELEELPTLAPLELPDFDFNMSTVMLANIAAMAESFQK